MHTLYSKLGAWYVQPGRGDVPDVLELNPSVLWLAKNHEN